jgi:uncharacterized membrane protein
MTRGAARHVYLDWVRGLAVLIMIEAHVLDSWTRASDRTRPAFAYAMMLGGMGAPLFLFLAGVAVVLSAESKIRRFGDFHAAWHSVQSRGWQIFGLAFLFRLQSFILGGFQNAAGLLKVDILNVMGPAIAAAAALGGMARNRNGRLVSFGAAAVTVAMLTPIVRATPLLSWLPDPVEWYFRPVPGRTNFTLFPWAGFVFAGAALGVLIDEAIRRQAIVRTQALLAAGSVALIVVAYQAALLPSIYPRSDFWTSSPTFFFIRTGVMGVVVAAAFFVATLPWVQRRDGADPLATFGKASLFVYWVHVELVYGFFSRPFRRSLSLEQVAVAFVFFTLFMLGLVYVKNRTVALYLTDSKSVI